MANSGTVTAGSAALASQYNNLRDDVLNVSTGHTHTGASENGAKVAATGVSSGTAALNAVLTADGSGGASFQALAAAGADVQEFTSSGSWVKPAGKSAVYVFAIGGGGGGASGARGSAALARPGGPGFGGGHSARWYKASDLAGTVTVTIGAGGAGGTAIASGTDSVFGVEGAYGGNTTFGTVSIGLGGPTGRPDLGLNNNFRSPVGVAEWGRAESYFSQSGGSSDAGGTALQASSFLTDLAVGLGHPTSGHNPVRGLTRSATGGCGGFGDPTAASVYGGAAGARGFGGNGTIITGGSAGTAGGTAANGQAGSVSAAYGLGHGGGGGGGALNAVPGNGGAGYRGGGGGGGGGVTVASGSAARASGAGGVGGDGYVLVVSV